MYSNFWAIMCSKMEVHGTHSHEPVFCFSTIPRQRSPLSAGRKEAFDLQLWDTMPRSFAVWPTTSLLLLAASQFASPTREDDQFWDRFFDAALGPYGRPHQSLLELHDFQTALSACLSPCPFSAGCLGGTFGNT